MALLFLLSYLVRSDLHLYLAHSSLRAGPYLA
jgi:hypothetical protein